MWRGEVTAQVMTERSTERGMLLLKGFNREECAHIFGEVIQINPTDSFAHWAIAYCHGADYNMYGPVYEAISMNEEWPSLKTALKHAKAACDHHNSDDMWAVIYEATLRRFEEQSLEVGGIYHLSDDMDDEEKIDTIADAADGLSGNVSSLTKYAKNLQYGLAQFENDKDALVYAVQAEALMLLKPWKLWNRDTMEETAIAKQVRYVLDEGLRKFPNDEWLCHLKVHYCEMGPKEQFDKSVLTVLEKSINGHLKHMPSHIYIQVGDYETSMRLNQEAVVLDNVHRCVSKSTLCLYSFYECHNFHFVVFAASMDGKYEIASQYARLLTEFVKTRLSEKNGITTALCQAFLMIEPMVYVRFGKWHVIKNLPEDRQHIITRAFTCYAKSIAYAATNDVMEAIKHRDSFSKLLDEIPLNINLHNESVRNIGKLALLVSDAEIMYRQNPHDDYWIEKLLEALQVESSLVYDEPPPWTIPVRQTLVALLLENRNTEEYKMMTLKNIREDLETWPKNVWTNAALVQYDKKYGLPSNDILKREVRLFAAQENRPQTSCACATVHFR